jgi:hypothetical protein
MYTQIVTMFCCCAELPEPEQMEIFNFKRSVLKKMLNNYVSGKKCHSFLFPLGAYYATRKRLDSI